MEMSLLLAGSPPLFVPRSLDLASLLKRKSYFLLGPRQTGKTWLIRHSLGNSRLYDLLDSNTFLSLSHDPGRLAEELTTRGEVVVIDEIQRLPILLNEVHRLIEERGTRFLLTGSSARRLRRGGVNLLGGRARVQRFHPLTSAELGARFQVEKAVGRGLIPSMYFSDDPQPDLGAYAGVYLQQEVIGEGAARSAPAFSRFLRIAALTNGTIVNFTNAANDAQVPRTTVYEYFEILKDTLILHELPPWRKGRKRKPLASSKYYFFDAGVVGALQGREFRRGTPEFGQGLETLLMHELTSWRDYRSGETLSFWRSTSGFEVDFLIGDHTAIELKAKATVSGNDLKSLRAISEEATFRRLICVCLEASPRRVGSIQILPLANFLGALWSGEYV